MYLQINTIKYNTDQEIANIYENLQIIWFQFFTDMLLFIYIRSTSNIYWFIGIQIRCQLIQTNSYSVTFGNIQYLVQHSMNDPEDKKNYSPLLNVSIYVSNKFSELANLTPTPSHSKARSHLLTQKGSLSFTGWRNDLAPLHPPTPFPK